jgi:hypothetical protein
MTICEQLERPTQTALQIWAFNSILYEISSSAMCLVETFCKVSISAPFLQVNQKQHDEIHCIVILSRTCAEVVHHLLLDG